MDSNKQRKRKEQEREVPIRKPEEVERDLGTVGGGRIPTPRSGMGKPPGGMSVGGSSVEGQAPYGTEAGGTSVRERGSSSTPEIASQPAEGTARNRVAHSQENIGGRAPGAANAPTGDRDFGPNAARRDYTQLSNDPMTARSPQRAEQQDEEQESQEGEHR